MSFSRAELMKEFNNTDDRSVDFSVDPDMFTKLSIKKSRKGEEKSSELEKIYEYQLKKDIDKIVKVRGPFQNRNDKYINLRHKDPHFHEVAKVQTFGENADFSQINLLTKEHHWLSTTQPYGILAHKRYVKYIKSLPTGPSDSEVKDKAQREMDSVLIERVLTGKIDKTRKQKIAIEAEQERFQLMEDAKNKPFMQERMRKAAIDDNEFEKTRVLPTAIEFTTSLQQWHKGIYPSYNAEEENFPIPSKDTYNYRDTVVDAKGIGRPYIPPKPSSETILKNNQNQEHSYQLHKSHVMYGKASTVLEKHQKEIEKQQEAQRIQKLKEQYLQKTQKITQNKSQQNKRIKEEENEDNGDNVVVNSPSQKANQSPNMLSSVKLSFSSSPDVQTIGKKVLHFFTPSKKYQTIVPIIGSPAADQEEEDPIASNSKDEEESPRKTNTKSLWDDWEIMSGGATHFDENGIYQSTTQVYKKQQKQTVSQFIHDIHQPEFKENFIDFRILEKQLAANQEQQQQQQEEAKEEKGTMNILQYLPNNLQEEDLAATNALYAKDPKYMTYREFLKYVKRKRKQWEKELNTLQIQRKKRSNYKLQHQIELLQMRIQYFENKIADISLFELASEEIVMKLQTHLENDLSTLLQIEDTFLERSKRKLYDILPFLQPTLHKPKLSEQEQLQKELLALMPSADLTYTEAIEYLANESNLDDVIPRKPSQVLYHTQVDQILANYFFEKKMEKSLKNAIFGQKKKEEEDMIVAKGYEIPKKTIDDLLVACNQGDYRTVIKLLDDREIQEVDYNPVLHCTVPVNSTNFDHITALYDVLSKIVQLDFADPTVSRQTELIQNLFASDWQLFYKKYFLSNKQKLASAAAFLRNLQLNKIIPLLFFYGADINHCRLMTSAISSPSIPDGFSILHMTVQTSQTGLLTWLLEHGSDVHQLTTRLQRSALMLAVQANQVEMVRSLLHPATSRSILTIQHCDAEGCNVLHHAARVNCDLRIVQMLLLCGVSKNVRNAAGYLPSEEARMKGHNEIATLIMTYKEEFDDLAGRLQFFLKYHQRQEALRQKMEAMENDGEFEEAEEGSYVGNSEEKVDYDDEEIVEGNEDVIEQQDGDGDDSKDTQREEDGKSKSEKRTNTYQHNQKNYRHMMRSKNKDLANKNKKEDPNNIASMKTKDTEGLHNVIDATQEDFAVTEEEEHHISNNNHNNHAKHVLFFSSKNNDNNNDHAISDNKSKDKHEDSRITESMKVKDRLWDAILQKKGSSLFSMLSFFRSSKA